MNWYHVKDLSEDDSTLAYISFTVKVGLVKGTCNASTEPESDLTGAEF